MTDVYKLLADIACSSIKEDWKYITIEIKSSMWEMFNTTPFYYLESGEKNHLNFQMMIWIQIQVCVFLSFKNPCFRNTNGTEPYTRLRKTDTSTWNLNGIKRFKTNGRKANQNKTHSTEAK